MLSNHLANNDGDQTDGTNDEAAEATDEDEDCQMIIEFADLERTAFACMKFNEAAYGPNNAAKPLVDYPMERNNSRVVAKRAVGPSAANGTEVLGANSTDMEALMAEIQEQDKIKELFDSRKINISKDAL